MFGKTNEKGTKGITLIALVITVIVLLILAGVTINALTGSESAMEKSTEAREKNDIANELEQIKLAITNAMANGLDGKVSDVNLRNELQGIIDDSELSKISGDGPWTIKTKLGKSYEINGYGQIEETVVLEPTDIYVALDGTTLRFYSQKDNVSGTLYTDANGPRNFKGVDFTDYNQIPWNNIRTSITRASIEDVIVPTSTARWFNETAITGIDHIENLKTSCVTAMDRMFRNCSSLTELDVSKFDTSNVTDMKTMFQSCSKLAQLDVSKFNTSKVTNMEWMFNGCSELTKLDVTKWDTSNVTNMSIMFQLCSELTELDVSNWDTSKVTDMSYMFHTCSNLITIYVGDKWNTDAVTQSSYMFTNCNNLVGGQGTTYNSSYQDKTRAKIDGGASDPGYFTHISQKGQIIAKVGDYIDFGIDLDDSGSTGDDWIILYNGIYSNDEIVGGKIYAITTKYLKNSKREELGIETGLNKNGDYAVYSTSQTSLMNKLTSDWKALINNNTSKIEGVEVFGAISYEAICKIRSELGKSINYYMPNDTITGIIGYWQSTAVEAYHQMVCLRYQTSYDNGSYARYDTTNIRNMSNSCFTIYYNIYQREWGIKD